MLMSSLEVLLRDVLPQDVEVEVAHLQSPPRETYPVVLPHSQANGKQQVVKIQHFFGLCTDNKLFYGLEVFVYVVVQHSKVVDKILFISKADTNGYCARRLSIKNITKALIEYVTSLDPLYYLVKVIPMNRTRQNYANAITKSTTTKRALQIIRNRHTAGKTSTPDISNLYTQFEKCDPGWTCKICLFTRSEPHYLFSESSKNPEKHILSGEQLLHWWLSVVDAVLFKNFTSDTKARLQIPGEEKLCTEKYLNGKKFPQWRVGDIFNSEPNDLAIFKIPVFPDDPKGRFLEQLVDENRAKKVQVTGFWTELQIQQEFRMGATVAVIGIDGRVANPCIMPRECEIILPKSIKASFQYDQDVYHWRGI